MGVRSTEVAKFETLLLTLRSTLLWVLISYPGRHWGRHLHNPGSIWLAHDLTRHGAPTKAVDPSSAGPT